MNLDHETEDRLAKGGYIIGQLQRVIFYEPGIKDTNWSATAPVLGPDGRAAPLGLPALLQGGPALAELARPDLRRYATGHRGCAALLGDLGSGALRLDANGFLGVEKSTEGGPAWSEGHPLSEAANQLIASMVRKVGGFTFQELNLTIDDIKNTQERGADLSYDFINRPAYQHALATEDTEFLRLTMNLARDAGVDTASLVHALQNHDEMTYELVHFATLHAGDTFTFRRRPISGGDLATLIRGELVERLTGERGPYNAIFTTNGISSTTASLIAAALGFRDLGKLSADDVESIQPSPPAARHVQRLAAGRFRALGLGPRRRPHPRPQAGRRPDPRRRHPLDPPVRLRPDGLPAGRPTVGVQDAEGNRSLYGALPDQLADDASFISGLRDILSGASEVRHRHGHPARRARGLQQGDARHGPPPREG